MGIRSSRLRKHLPVIFELIEKGLTGAKIAKRLDLPKATVNYWLSILEKKRFILREFRSNFVRYKVNQSLFFAENPSFIVPNDKPILHDRIVYRRHFLAFSFRILRDARLPFDREVKLRGNSQFFWSLKKWNATVKKTSQKVIVHLKPKAGTDPKVLFDEGLREAQEIRGFLQDSFGIELGDAPFKVGKEHYGVLGDPLAESLHKRKEVFDSDALGIDNSPKALGELDLKGVEVAQAYEQMILNSPDVSARLEALDSRIGDLFEIVKSGITQQQTMNQLASMIVHMQDQLLNLQKELNSRKP